MTNHKARVKVQWALMRPGDNSKLSDEHVLSKRLSSQHVAFESDKSAHPVAIAYIHHPRKSRRVSDL